SRVDSETTGGTGVTQMAQIQTPGPQKAQTAQIILGLVLTLLVPVSSFAENRWAVIISGASGGEKYAEQMATWRNDLRAALVDRYQFKPEFVKILVDEAATSGEKGSAENVRKLFAEVKKTATK